ncbi:MAG TPA: Holliday junction resolvase RuvX [Candidatus Acidoferrum sp.]|nr:Holliday junction resolvase RuvX [Candidatus Acidoferrum sp.]
MKAALHSPAQTATSKASGRVLAIDYGRKRLGLAISDELGVTSRPLSTFARTNRRDDLRRLRLLAREHGVSSIVVGLPLHLDGAESEMAAEATRFATRLSQHLGISVEMAEERLTSWEATEHAPRKSRAHGVQRKSGKHATRDDIAAAIILRDYLAARLPARKRASAARAKT